MDLGTGTGGSFTSDIDILGCLSDFPKSKQWIYYTWEVKVSLLCKNGSVRSLKVGKLERTMKQLRAYRNFGSPIVSLLDVFLCEEGYFQNNKSLPAEVEGSILAKREKLSNEGFGYQHITFEHNKKGNDDVGLSIRGSSAYPELLANNTSLQQPFSRLAEHIGDFFDKIPTRPRKSFMQIVFCRKCRSLQLVNMKEEYKCAGCGDDLIMQS